MRKIRTNKNKWLLSRPR